MTAETTNTYPMTPEGRSVFTPSPEKKGKKPKENKPKDLTEKKELEALKG